MSRSLRRQFLLISAATSAIALVVAGMFLSFLYERDLRDRVHAEIHHHLIQLLANLEVDRDGRIRVTQQMADPRFRQPLSGLYWEVDGRDGQVLTSRSLWDATLHSAQPSWANVEQPTVVNGPFDQPVLLHVRLVNLGDGAQQRELRVMIALDESEIREPAHRFAWRLALSLGVLAVAFLLVTAAQLALVMSPLRRLRRSVLLIRDGVERRVTGSYPVEIEPIAGKLNTLLSQNEQTVENARARASNLAHSLKTPLTIIDVVVAGIRDKGAREAAAAVSEQTQEIRKRVERELVRARMAAGHGQPLRDAGSVLSEVVKTIRLLPRGQELDFEIHAAAGEALRMDREDFIELVGNILDNARKWARSRVRIALERQGSELCLTISDDGPGIPQENMAVIAERGRRLDESAEGTGIGLAIAADIVNAYRLKMSLARAEAGGLSVTITFPPVARLGP